MKKPDIKNYIKIVEWSDEDQCYVGTAPGLLLGGVHGKNQKKVFEELCQVVDEVIHLYKKEGKNLPEPIASKKYTGKILLRITPDLHKNLAIEAYQKDVSINGLIESQLGKIV